MVETIIKSQLGTVLVALPLTILANNLLGAALAEIDVNKSYNSGRLKRGLTKGAMVYISIMLYTIISTFMTDLTIDILGGTYTLVDAMYIIIFGTIVMYAKDGIQKLMTILNYNEEEAKQKEEDNHVEL